MQVSDHQLRSVKSISTIWLLIILTYSLARGQENDPLFRLRENTIDFTNAVPSFERMNVLISQYHYNGAGVAIGDINNDGLPDIFINANFGADKLFLNRGDFQFEDISRQAGIQGTQSWETGVNMVDINNDGFLDIYVCRSGHAPETSYSNLFYINNGDLTFSERSLDFGLFDASHSTQSHFFDYDLDGDLDLYLLNHNPKRTYDYDFGRKQLFRDDQVGDILFRNDGGYFVDVSSEAGIIGKSISYGLGALIGDLDNNGSPDIYVCNDFGERDYLYFNNGDGTFREDLVDKLKHISWYSMGGDVADINNDGLLDLMILDMTASDNYRQKVNMNDMNPEKFQFALDNGLHYQYMVNTLQLNVGHGTFSEIAQMAGVAYTDWSWSALLADFDQDGHNDMVISNGYRVDISNKDYRIWLEKRQKELAQLPTSERNAGLELQEALTKLPKQRVANYAFRNNQDLTFADMSKEWGLDAPSFSNGMAYGDLDNDGDLDLVISNIDEPAFVYENTASLSENKHIRIVLQGPPNNRMGLGAKIVLHTSEGKKTQEFYNTRGYLSSVEPVVHFGIGEEIPLKVEVTWHDQSVSVVQSLSANTEYTVAYSDGKGHEDQSQDTKAPLITEVEAISPGFRHEENAFDDFSTELLLPHRLSTQGPALVTGDVNGDGLQDLFVGGARNQSSALYLQDPEHESTWNMITSAALNEDKKYEDVAASLLDIDHDGDLDLYVVSGGTENPQEKDLYEDRIYLNDGGGTMVRLHTKVPVHSSGSCVLTGDYDGDGDLDLFVGGRVIPGNYPAPANSHILRNNDGTFEDVTKETCPALQELGLVTDATWIDMDLDGDLDLAVVGEWMAPTFLIQEQGKFEPSTDHGLQDEVGWWFSVTPADIDNDGDEDLLLGNLGLNYKYKASQSQPFEIYFDDFDQNNKGDIVLGYHNDSTLYPVRGKQCSSEQMPFISEKFPTYEEFAEATLVDVYGAPALSAATHYRVTNFQSGIAINDGIGHFSLSPLPKLAQVGPINDAAAIDYNLDGHCDFLIVGNLYESEVETPRADAGKGWLLEGDGTGGFEIVHPMEAGLFADNNVKNMQVLDSDGKVVIFVAASDAEIKVFELSKK